MTKPISPDEVVLIKEKIIPKEVIEAFNEIISKNWDGSSSTFKQKDITALILQKMNGAVDDIRHPDNRDVFTSQYLYDNKLLDVEPIYENNGWSVYYDKPGYNETYDATFCFKRK